MLLEGPQKESGAEAVAPGFRKGSPPQGQTLTSGATTSDGPTHFKIKAPLALGRKAL